MFSPSELHAIEQGHLAVLSAIRKVKSNFEDHFPCVSSQRTVSGSSLANYIEHTLLKPSAVKADFEQLCAEAVEHGLFAVCVPTNRLGQVTLLLKNTSVKLVTVVGFPNGYALTEAKVEETRVSLAKGADEIDMVLPQGLLKDQDYWAVYQDIRAVVDAASQLPVKVILETSELNQAQKIAAAYLAAYAGASFLKTSTGFSPSGVSLEDLALLRFIAADQIGVKASGGVRTPEFARQCIETGADRIGTSSSLTILGLGSKKGQEY